MNLDFARHGTLARAVAFAAHTCDSQPALTQALERLTIAATLTADPEVLAAAVLRGCDSDQLRAQFGERVARLADFPRPADAPDGWQKSRLRAVRKLSIADPGQMQLSLADHLCELRSLRRGLSKQGPALWQRFAQTNPSMHHWYHTSVSQALSPLAETGAHREYLALIREVFGGTHNGK